MIGVAMASVDGWMARNVAATTLQMRGARGWRRRLIIAAFYRPIGFAASNAGLLVERIAPTSDCHA